MKNNTKNNLNHAINLLSAMAAGAVAFMFIAFALTYESYAFINNYRMLWIWLTFGVISAMMIAYVFCYVFEKKAAYRLILICFIFADILGAVFYAVCASGFILKITGIDALRDYIDDFGAWAAALYIAFSFLQVVILPVPGSVTVAAGVALFGPLKCSVYSFIGIASGSVAAFAIGRVVGYKAVRWMVGEDTLKKWLAKVKGKDYLILSIMFLLPLFPDDVLCFVAGLSSMTWLYFIIMIIITRLLSVVTTSYSFNFIPVNEWWGICVWLAIAVMIVVLFWLVWKYSDRIDGFIKRRFKNKKERK